MRSSYIKILYGAILLLLISVTLAAYWNQLRSNEEAKWVRHSSRVLGQLESLLSVVKDAEIGHRGFQLTQDTSFLEPYHQSVASLEDDVRTLDSLLLDQEDQRTRKDSLKYLILRQYNIIKSILENERESQAGMTRYEMNLLVMGKQNMDKIRDLVGTMAKEEEAILQRRIAEAKGTEEVAPISLLVYAFSALGGVTVLFFLLTIELGRRRKTEAELSVQAEDLKRSNEDLEQFAYVASHDLQEPLRKIRAFGDRLEATFGDQLGETGGDYIRRMQNAAERMQALIDDLLSFSRLSRQKNTDEPLDLNELVQEVEEDMETAIERADAVVSKSELPVVRGDRGQLKRLFQNLISNALKFRHPERTPVVEISAIKVKRDEIHEPIGIPKLQDYYRITLKDNGIGFDEKYAEKIFVIFQRLHGRSAYEGTGIGLAICRKIVANHKGFIMATGVEGEGAVFAIFLPLSPENE